MDNLINILLQRNDSTVDWGFHLASDSENQMIVDRVKSGTMCSFYMSPGDAVLKVAGRSTKAMTVEKARHLIIQSGNAVELIIKKRPQGSTWSPVTPSTPTFNPSKFTPAAQQTAWKPFQMSEPKGNDEAEVIQGSVKVDPSGGYVHTFGAPKRESTPQSSISNASDTSPWQNSRSPHQEPMIITSAPRCVQEIIIPTNDTSNQFRSPVRQTSYQSNASQFSPVQQSPQRSPASPVYYQVQNNGFDNAPNGNSAVIFHTPRQVSSPYQINRQESVPYQASRQDSVPYQQTRQEPVTYQVNRQDSVPYQAERQNSNLYQQNSYSSPMVRQESTSYPPSRQDSWNQPIHQETRQYSPSRQQSWSNQPVQQNSNVPFNRQESLSNKPVPVNSSFPTNRQDSWSNDPNRQNSVPYQSPGLQPVRGLFANQNSIPSSNTEQIEQYEPVVSNSTPACQRQSSIQQYQSSPKPYSPTNRSPIGGQQPEFNASNNASSPYTYGVPGPFARQQSSGPQSWSSAPAEAFPTPPPFSPATESAGAPWPSSSELPTPPPPPPPSFSQPNPGPVAMPPPPPPPPPPPMPSSAGVSQEVPAWKKQIKATKEAKAAAGIVPQTPGTPSGPEMPAALANSMKKDKKPFTYLPGGLDLSEIRSPKMQRRLIANQQYAPPPPSCTGQQVLLQPRGNGTSNQAQQLPNQLERLNLGEEQSGMTTAVEPQRRPSADGQDPRNYGQSRSFRLLQMMTGGDDETDSAPVQPSVARKEEDEMRFTGLRRPDHPIPSRAFQALQKMTSGNEDTPNTTADPRYNQDSTQEQQDDTPVDIRYKGGYIPGRSFKMLQEMTGMNEDGTPTGTVVPSVLQEKRQQRKAPPHLHLNINQPPPPKQFPQPSVPASQQATDDAPKMYTGGRIPSQSFRILQAMTGDNPQNTGEDGTDM